MSTMSPHRETDTRLDSIKFLYRLALQACAKIDWIGPLVVRLIIGFAFIVDGTRKLGDLESVAKFFAKDLHMMHPCADSGLVSVVELIAGLLLVIGLGTRIAALLLAFTMVGAFTLAIVPHSKSVLDLFGTIELTYMAIFVWLIVSGGGPISIDHRIARREARRPPDENIR